jgi:hypothetical protein
MVGRLPYRFMCKHQFFFFSISPLRFSPLAETLERRLRATTTALACVPPRSGYPAQTPFTKVLWSETQI